MLPTKLAALPEPIQKLITPAKIAFLVSLLLSLSAAMSSTINRDGMLYIETARIFLDQGFAAAKLNFAWPFLSIFIAATSKITGLPLEAAGYLLNALFMAGASAFLVSATSRVAPPAAWTICLVVLALPGINEYRNELLREFGCWFFIMAAFWLAHRWAEQPRWGSALVVQGLIGVAALFRPEAVAMIPALIMWQLFEAPRKEKLRRTLMIGGLAIAGLIGLLALYIGGHLSSSSRLSGEFSRLSMARFDAKAETISMAFIDYARGQARTILFFGSLAIIPVKFIHKIGILLVPLVWFLYQHDNCRSTFRRFSIYLWGFAAHLLVLAVFVLDLQFLAGRYVGLLLLCAAPVIGLATWHLLERFRRWRPLLIALLVLLMIGSSVSLSGGKTHFIKAGQWAAINVPVSPRVFVGSPRTAYYAGWRLKDSSLPPVERGRTEALINELTKSRSGGVHDLYILEVTRGDILLSNWIEQSGLDVIQRFPDAKGSAVVVLSTVKTDTGQKVITR